MSKCQRGTVPVAYAETSVVPRTRSRVGAGTHRRGRAVGRKLLFLAVGVALLAVPVAVVFFRLPTVNLTSHASPLKCYDKTGNPKAC
jgi:hypothetical protein